MDYLALALLSFGLSLDDFGLAFSLSLLMPSRNFKKFIVNTGKIAAAFSISAMGCLSSIDEGAVGISFPFLEIPIIWIIIAIIIANTILILIAALLSNWMKNLSRRIPSILSGIILITLGVLKFLELAFEV